MIQYERYEFADQENVLCIIVKHTECGNTFDHITSWEAFQISRALPRASEICKAPQRVIWSNVFSHEVCLTFITCAPPSVFTVFSPFKVIMVHPGP